MEDMLMSSYPLRAGTCGCLLMVAAALAAHGQTPQSRRTTSAVEQLGLDDTAAGATGTGATGSGVIRELRCRGKAGIDLRIDRDPSPRQPKLVAMTLRYGRPERKRSFAQEGMGLVDHGVSLQFLPGTCTWNPGGFKDIPPEPGEVYFDLPRDGQAWLSPGDRDTTIGAAVHFPDVASLSRYLNDPERYWVFYVDDLTGVAISYSAWPRGGGLPAPTAGTEPPPHEGPVRDASTVRSGSDQRSPEGAAASSPGAGTGGEAVDSSRSVVTVPGAREPPPSPGAKRFGDARHGRQVRLGSGIRDVTALPGPRGVRLVFNLERGGRAQVQFSRKPPAWDEREGFWTYPKGFQGPWYARVEFNRSGAGYEAVPRADLEAGVRYYYLITVYGKETSSPTGQRTGSFTATMGP
jgi:hypothetical protein